MLIGRLISKYLCFIKGTCKHLVSRLVYCVYVFFGPLAMLLISDSLIYLITLPFNTQFLETSTWQVILKLQEKLRIMISSLSKKTDL